MRDYALEIFPRLVHTIEESLKKNGSNPKKCWISINMGEFVNVQSLNEMTEEHRIISFVKNFVFMHFPMDSNEFNCCLREQGDAFIQRGVSGKVGFESKEDLEEFISYINLQKGKLPEGEDIESMKKHFGMT